MSAKLAAWLSGNPYSPKPRICWNTRSANSGAMPFATMRETSRSRCCSMRPLRRHAAMSRRSWSASPGV